MSVSFGPLGCGTDAVGVEACLTIERARCEAAHACGLAESAACQRSVEVQCLHGFSKSALPNERQTTQCADTLGQLAECVDKRGERVSAERCELELRQERAQKACDLVDAPERLRACTFLAAEDEETDEERDEETDEGQPDAGKSGSSSPNSVKDAGELTPVDPEPSDANP